MIVDIKTVDLTTATEVGTSAITVRLVGSAETDAKKDLDVYLRQVHQTAIDSKSDEVVVDFRSLEFMNSSCFKAFVSWMVLIQDLPAASQYKVRFLSASKKHWQGRSLNALSSFAVGLVQVDVS